MFLNPELCAKSALVGLGLENAIPINPITVANGLGVKVFFDSSLGNLSGYYDEQSCSIFVNGNDSLLRKRFTIAHELGHHVMRHGSSPRDSSQFYSQVNYDLKETLANRFAAELLMPDHMVKFIIESEPVSFDRLTDAFGVSDQAMKIRLQRLGYIQ